jgi:hypothetical protein
MHVLYIDNSPVSSFVIYPVSESEVESLFNSLDGNRSSTSVPNILIKTASNILSPVFTVIFNEYISTDIVPDVLKIASIMSIFKSGAVTDTNNYRTMSILPPFAKILERLVYNQLQSFLTKHNIIYDYQFGFRKGHSTDQAILETTDYSKKSIDKNEVTCGLFLDFSKAFDTVNHEILLSKLYRYGIQGIPLLCFRDYLTNRYQYVKFDNVESEQRSTLGPLLFILYINDMPNCSKKLSFRIFADDTNIFYSHISIDEIERVMNDELHHIIQYCNINKISINYNKTNYMVITSTKKKIRHITISNIEEKLCIKYLGAYIDNKLNWKYQIKHVQSKIAKNLGILKKLRYYTDLKILKQLYHT